MFFEQKRKKRKKSELNILNDLVTIVRQYFPELINKFNSLTDLRNQSYIKYKMKVIFIVRLLGLMCEIKSMHGMTRELNTKESIENIAQICDLELEEIPHCDTINDVFEKVKVGRNRWKIENEGFNIQKNGTFDIGHLYSKNQTAIKVHYLMIQIAHILRQMLEKGIKEIKELRLKLKEISQKLKQELISTIRNLTVHSKIQLRFD